MSLSGIGNEDKPVGSFLFAGPTGVGKTEVTRQLARMMGLLTEAINKTPHAVLLLDEIEKAHPDVFNLLLQVMDHGSLTDTNGRKTDFRHVIMIMTTNAGAEQASRASIEFKCNKTYILTRIPQSFRYNCTI